jgi:16S rRNA (guanine1207-N2)-methyltransferase
LTIARAVLNLEKPVAEEAAKTGRRSIRDEPGTMMPSTRTNAATRAASSQRLLPPTQLLLRNIDRIRGDNLLIAGAPGDDAIVSSFGGRSGRVLTFDYAAHLLFSRLLGSDGPGLTTRFSATYESPDAPHDVAVVYLQKGAELNELVLATVASVMAPGAPVLFVGENKAGIRSAAEILERRIGPIVFSDAARHSVVYLAHASLSAPQPVDLASWEKVFPVDAAGRSLSVVSLPGVFSHGRLDEGTAFLLNHLPADTSGDVLDFGCGAGVIGAFVKSVSPECRVTLVDSNAFALAATSRSFERNALAAKLIQPSDGLAGVPDRFDLIVSNPPFHQGVATNYDVSSSFLSASSEKLRPGGTLIVVANKFLPYESVMSRALGSSVVLAQNNKYKVLKGTKRP